MSLQSRIAAFEAISQPRPPLQTPISPRVIPSTPPRVSPSPSPPNLGRKSSLLDFKIDLKDWVLDDGSPPRGAHLNGLKRMPTQPSFSADGDALIHFSPPKPSSVNANAKAPPLPPRKPSLASLKSVGSSSSLPPSRRSPILPPPPRRGDSLTVDHTYPPPGLTLDLSSRGHTQDSSISSFHSVSLSDPSSASPATAVFSQHTTGSSFESFEELSASAALASPTTAALISHDWEKAMARRQQQPPKLPARPGTGTAAPAASPPPPARRTAPPPPSIRSIASSSVSSFASTSSTKSSTSRSASTSKSASSPTPPTSALTARAPPVPPGPRARYDALFAALLSAHAHARPALLAPRPGASPARRTAAGWRGLSVDLIRDPARAPGADAPQGETLPGPILRVLWARSRLPMPVLSTIWSECDVGRTGALDREAFARGMWRIDEELRRAEAGRSRGVGTGTGRWRGVR